MGMNRLICVFLASVLTSSSAWAGNGFKAIAKEISKAAKKAGMERVAVLPFIPADGSSSHDGWSISEKLTTQVVRGGQVQAVERSLLKQLMDEQQLGQTGILEQSMLKKIGKVFAVEGVITGSFVTLGSEVVVQARLINVETGVIIMASERRAAREWFDSFHAATDSRTSLASLWVPVPELTVEAPPLPPSLPNERWDGLRDSLADDSCANAAERVDTLNKQILDLKARYWALRLKKGVPISGLRHNPGSEITDPLLKKELYDRMKAWYTQENIPELAPYEVKRFVYLDSKAFSLYRQCGV